MDYESANKKYKRLAHGENVFDGLGSASRQKQEYRSDNWNKLCGLTYGLIEDLRFAKKPESKGTPDSVHGEAFVAGISGRCPDCTEYNELEAENDKLKAELETHRWIPVSERLPDARDEETEYSKHVLCSSNISCFTKVDQYLTKQGRWSSHRTTWTHWQEIILPK